MRNWVRREPSPARGQRSRQGHRRLLPEAGCRDWVFFPLFGETKGSLLLLLMYFCSSLNKKLWFLKDSESGRGEVGWSGVLGFQALWSVLLLPLEHS